jgi:hypothetical protein
VAIFSYSIGQQVSRGSSKGAVASAAYLSRECYYDERQRQSFDYREREPDRGSEIAEASAYIGRSGRHGAEREAAVFVGLYAPKEAPEWCRGREHIEEFWNRLEAFEKHPRAQIAERIIIALPHELTLEQNTWLIQDHIREFTRQGRVVQVAIHAPEHGDERNVHAHLLISTRGVNERGFNEFKTREQQERYLHRREYVQGLRERWEKIANRHLDRHGHEVRIDHRTLKDQGLDREPSLHVGPKAMAREREGIRTEIGSINRAIAERNAARERAHREIAEIEVELGQIRKRERGPAREAVQEQEAEREPAAAPAPANTPSDAPQRGRARAFFGRAGRLVRDGFEATLDWIAPRVDEPEPQRAEPPAQNREADRHHHRDPAADRAAQAQQLLELYQRTWRTSPGRERHSKLFERYQAEREQVLEERKAAIAEINARLAAYDRELKDFYNLRFIQEKNSGLPGVLRHEAMELLIAQRRGDRKRQLALAAELRHAAREKHPLLTWQQWLEREAERGDKEAERALGNRPRRPEREPSRERGRDRGDDLDFER